MVYKRPQEFDYGQNRKNFMIFIERSTARLVVVVENACTSDIQREKDNNVKLSATVNPPIL